MLFLANIVSRLSLAYGCVHQYYHKSNMMIMTIYCVVALNIDMSHSLAAHTHVVYNIALLVIGQHKRWDKITQKNLHTTQPFVTRILDNY